MTPATTGVSPETGEGGGDKECDQAKSLLSVRRQYYGQHVPRLGPAAYEAVRTSKDLVPASTLGLPGQDASRASRCSFIAAICLENEPLALSHEKQQVSTSIQRSARRCGAGHAPNIEVGIDSFVI